MPIIINFIREPSLAGGIAKIRVDSHVALFLWIAQFGKLIVPHLSPSATYYSRSVAIVDLRDKSLLIASTSPTLLSQLVGRIGPHLVEHIRKVRFLLDIHAQDKHDKAFANGIAAILHDLRLRFSSYATINILQQVGPEFALTLRRVLLAQCRYCGSPQYTPPSRHSCVLSPHLIGRPH